MAGGSVKDVQSQAELERRTWVKFSLNFRPISLLPRFLRVEAEEHPEISESYSVSAVPYFVFFKDGKLVDALVGADPSSLANKVAKVAGLVNHSEPPASVTLGMAFGPTVPRAAEEFAKSNGSSGVTTQLPSSQNNEINSKLQQLIDSHPVMLLMKGSPDGPKCSFSQKIIEILKKEEVAFGSFDILLEEEVREG
ncbi:hypothetical protein Nepgr_017693 [Nepenthes gracilis]|uniref:Uncharacterized protein n=1 Tax=Nepenthes gracilis TaxID=150966 RepID=A0AAD3XSD9_NEPGR|nr:hypothetical protein Nepgr_017693 [Nepenthes gracilis]